MPYFVATDFTTYLGDGKYGFYAWKAPYILKQTSSIRHVSNLSERQRRLVDSWSTLSVPSFNIALELLAGIKDAIVVALVMYRSC
jgi:hypothetical protein